MRFDVRTLAVDPLGARGVRRLIAPADECGERPFDLLRRKTRRIAGESDPAVRIAVVRLDAPLHARDVRLRQLVQQREDVHG